VSDQDLSPQERAARRALIPGARENVARILARLTADQEELPIQLAAAADARDWNMVRALLFGQDVRRLTMINMGLQDILFQGKAIEYADPTNEDDAMALRNKLEFVFQAVQAQRENFGQILLDVDEMQRRWQASLLETRTQFTTTEAELLKIQIANPPREGTHG
jgi:hypothetical protein